MNTAPIVSKVWSFCTTLRDDGVSYGDYLEQLTYLIFLKMADEYAKPPYNRDVGIPVEYNWQSLKSKKGRGTRRPLRHSASSSSGLRRAYAGPRSLPRPRTRSRTQRSCIRLIDMVDDTEWVTMGADVKGDIYEGLAGEECRGHQVRRRPVFHAARPHPGHGRMRTARTGYAHRRPGLRHRRFLSRAPTTSSPTRTTSASTRSRKPFLKHEAFHGQRDRRQYAQVMPNEHVLAQHRRDRRRCAHFAKRFARG